MSKLRKIFVQYEKFSYKKTAVFWRESYKNFGINYEQKTGFCEKKILNANLVIKTNKKR